MKLNKAREKLVEMYIQSLEEDRIPWKKGWDDAYSIKHHNPVSNSNYHGVNNALLSIVSMVEGYKDPRWMTFKQIKDKGWHLEKGARGCPVEFWSVYDKVNKQTVTLSEYTIAIANNPDSRENFVVMDKTYYVFNAELVKGIPEYVIEEQPKKVMNSSLFLNNLIKNMKVGYKEEGNRAYYSPSQDIVVLPTSGQFHSQYEYESTKLHELCHASGHSSRLNRPMIAFFGTDDYAKEELRAEMAASFIAQEVSVDASQMDLDNHKAYIQSWISTLHNNSEELFKAIKDAEKICDYILETGELEKIRLQENSDYQVEQLWEELEDVPVYENEKYELCLDVDWQGWSKGTTQDEIWHWFDENHSKGIGWLMNEYESNTTSTRAVDSIIADIKKRQVVFSQETNNMEIRNLESNISR